MQRTLGMKRPVSQTVKGLTRTAYMDAILDAAERLFSEHGFHEAKMADLAAEAGVAVGTLYKYFPGKDDVFASLATRGRKDLARAMAECLGIQDPVERLEALLDRLFEFIESRGALFAIYVQLGAGFEWNIRSLGGPSSEQTYDEFLKLFEQIFQDAAAAGRVRRDVQPAILATTLAGVISATLFSWARAKAGDKGRERKGQRVSLVERRKPMLKVFLEGARA
jgi:AcrR family transcriptional regulator